MKRDVLILDGHISNEDNIGDLFFDFIQKENLYFIGETSIDKTFNIFLVKGYVYSDTIKSKKILEKFNKRLNTDLCNFIGLKKIDYEEIKIGR